MIVGFYNEKLRLGVGEPEHILECTIEEYWFLELTYATRNEDESHIDINEIDPYPYFYSFDYEFCKETLEKKRINEAVNKAIKVHIDGL